MKKTSIKQREPIALRAKALAGGRQSLYLDYYQEGSRNHAHKYEFLKMYLLPETSKEIREQNKATLQAAKAIQAQKLIERANGKAHITAGKSKMQLTDYIMQYAKKKEKLGQSKERANAVYSLLAHIKQYNGEVLLVNVDKEYCTGFAMYLTTATSFNADKKQTTIAKSTANNYWIILASVLNEAVREELIQTSPVSKVNRDIVKAIAPEDSTRTYLTIDEIKALSNAKCGNEETKAAFMFACFCGLRISDIRSLRWEEIKTIDGQTFVYKKMQKTQRYITIPLSDTAVKFLPKKGNNTFVFHLPTKVALNAGVKAWAKRAGIDKDICFHVSRHTYATTLLTQGADLYTTSKLLGHTNIKTTQIYAEIVDAKKVEAVNLLDNIKL